MILWIDVVAERAKHVATAATLLSFGPWCLPASVRLHRRALPASRFCGRPRWLSAPLPAPSRYWGTHSRAPKPLRHCPPLQLVPCCGRALTVEPLFCFYFFIILFNRRRLRTAGIRHRSRSPAIRRSHSPSIRRPSRSPAAIPAPTRPSPILRHKHNSSLSSGYSSLLAMCATACGARGFVAFAALVTTNFPFDHRHHRTIIKYSSKSCSSSRSGSTV